MPAPLATLSYLRNVFRDNPMMIPFSRQTHMFIANICQNVYIREFAMRLAIDFWFPTTECTYRSNTSISCSGTDGFIKLECGPSFSIIRIGRSSTEHFDFGLRKNLKNMLNQSNRSMMHQESTHDIALFYTSDDWFNKMNSIEMLKSDLKVELMDDYLVPDPSYNHMDLVWAKNAGTLVNKRVLDILSRY
ncbi:hypothetical protein SSS_01057 [Sarcoptes scabiei]|uniref:Uncharacterized protein n=1 Tax=Sarcoptes scabiei TaxID=52283 RepID=A0A834VCL7_SARSC|nr:hypothetical protein SSS_01057 [Sarcoptes scabiei]